MSRRDTPLLPPGSGEFLRDQANNTMRQLCETLRECPKCDGEGEIRITREVGNQYWISIATCPLCEGAKCVPKWKVA